MKKIIYVYNLFYMMEEIEDIEKLNVGIKSKMKYYEKWINKYNKNRYKYIYITYLIKHIDILILMDNESLILKYCNELITTNTNYKEYFDEKTSWLDLNDYVSIGYYCIGLYYYHKKDMNKMINNMKLSNEECAKDFLLKYTK